MEDKGLYSSGDAREKYISQQYIKPRNIYEGTDLEGQKEIDDIRAKRELQFNSNLSRDRQKALEVGLGLRDPKQGFWDSGLGTLVKGAGAAVAWPLASAFAPKELVTAARWGKRVKDIKEGKGVLGWGAKKLGLDQKVNNLTSTIDKAKATKFRDERTTLGKEDIENWERKQDWSDVKPPKDDRDGQQVTTVQEAIAGKGLEEGQKMLGIDEIKKRHRLLETTLNDGYYVDNKGRTIQLNDQQKAMLTDYISQIDKYLVNVDTRVMSTYGGRIDKPLMGRSRDI